MVFMLSALTESTGHRLLTYSLPLVESSPGLESHNLQSQYFVNKSVFGISIFTCVLSLLFNYNHLVSDLGGRPKSEHSYFGFYELCTHLPMYGFVCLK